MKIYQLEIPKNKKNANLLKELQEFVSHLTIKKVTNFKSHDGIPLKQADLYYKGKKVCFVSEDGWGGETRFDDYGIIEWIKIDKEDRLPRPTEFRDEFDNKFQSLEYTTPNSIKYDYIIKLNLEQIVMELFKQHDLNKDQKKGIVVQSEYGWDVVGYKTSIPTMQKKYSKEALKHAFQKIYNEQIKEGKTILNKEYLQTTLGIAI